MRRTTIARAKRSKKRSGASSPPPLKSVTFFIDRSLGRAKVAIALRAAGATVFVHDDLFRSDTTDVVWLAEAGKRGWIVLSKDRRIRTRRSEIAQILAARVAAFVLASAELTGDEMAAAFVVALPRMVRMVQRQRRPFIARVGPSGLVELLALPKRR